MVANPAEPREHRSHELARLAVARPRLPTAERVLPYLQRIDEARWYSNFGPLVTELEQRLAERFDGPAEVVTVANATQALTLTLMAMKLPAGGYVATPAWTFVATAHAIIAAGLRPWFVDVDPDTWMLQPDAVRDLVERHPGQIVAAIPVCAFGDLGDLAGWKAFQEDTGLPVLVDAAAAFDTLTDCDLPSVVSLHATKVLGLGEGGFLATRDPALALKVRQLTTFGFSGSRESLAPATNAKLSEYAGAVGLAALDAWPADRLRFMRAAQLLRIGLIGLPQVRFQSGWGSDWITSVCCVGLPSGSSDAVAETLGEHGVDTRRWWAQGCHRSPAFAHCRSEELPATDRLAASVLGLPFSIDISEVEVRQVVDALRQALPDA